MHIIRALVIIVFCVLVGEVLSFYLSFPASILAFIVAFILLITKVLKIEKLEETANMLLKVSSVFFLSYFVNLLSLQDELKGYWLAFFAICIISGLFSLIITALVLNFLDKEGM